MAQRGQFVGHNAERWTIDLETFLSNFGESSHPRATNLLYEIHWGGGRNSWKNFCTNDHPVHAEIIFLEDHCEMIEQRYTTPCSITWYLSWSPCGKCSHKIIEFLEENPHVTLDIRVARLYKYNDERNRQGLRDLDEYGVNVSIMDRNDYSYCLRTFVANQRTDEGYWPCHFLHQIYSKELYLHYSEELDWILE